MILKIGVLVNRDKYEAYDIAKRIPKFLMNTELITDDAELAGSYKFAATDALLGESDVVIVIGGDGTIMHTAKKAAYSKKPVLGINAGRVGFLAGLESDELNLLENLPTGNFKVENRMILTSVIEGKSYDFVNDLVIVKTGFENLIDISAGYSYSEIHYRADGLIISTPTGSTAYSLSAGGPILDPTSRCILVTPICPHMLFSRSIIFGDRQNICACLADKNQTADIVIDGEEKIRISGEQTVEIMPNRNISARFITFKSNAFYDVLSSKIK